MPEEPGAMPVPVQDGLERIWTVPNLLSAGRLGLIAVFCWLLFGPDDRIAAAAALAVAGATDFVDGYVARRFNQVTMLGKVLDPTADRVVVVTGVIAITLYGALPVWLAVLVLAREVLVSSAVLALAALGARRIDVLWVGKAGTFGLMGCFPLFLLSYAPQGWARDLRDVTFVLVVPALLLSLLAAVSYVPLARKALAERADRRRPANAVAP
ncbi:MAG: CDP-alcohol phosphatidyltransferase family protein [Actinomycetota bacterium]|nr:CDP-alcohol phosphatidyltransferase family protein [Actinomycetota bacterium]